MDVHSVGGAGAKLFERIPDRLFSPLASTNRLQYWSLLCYLYRRRFGPDAPLPPSRGFAPRDLLQDVEDHIRYAPDWHLEDGDGPGLSVDQRASNYFRRLVQAGWFRTEKHGLAQTISMAPPVNQMLTLLIDYADKDPVFVSGKIHSIDALITKVMQGEGGGDLFREAAEQCRNLLIYIRTTGTNVRDLMASISTQETTADYARRFFQDYVVNMFIGDYKELRTQEHPLAKRPHILQAVEKLATIPEHRAKLMNWYITRLADGDEARAAAAFGRDLRRLEELNRVEEYLERLDDEVRSANKCALIVLQYRLQTIRPIDDLLRQAIDGLLGSGLEGGFEGAMDALPQVFAPDALMSAARLAQPRKEIQRLPPAPLRKAVLSEHTRAVGNLVRRAQERRRITPAKLRDYAKAALGEHDKVKSQDLPVDSIENLRAYQSFNSLATALKSKIATSGIQARKQIPGFDVVCDEDGTSEHPFLIAQSFQIRLRKTKSDHKRE
ncbi:MULTISPECIES: Wadjet anti-phage system protein JetA family protein [unclassified Pseudomonas]|uniref:Wadjet anti-phage system protein JetA family protein n=1 Tax=unclassified Pseudomonas TaxID=196821 RepID=UPI001CBD7DC1|nr:MULTISPECIES: Wadjet anti-phage system protein JetA family protein [unclassified Pseudomonas]